MKRPLLFLLFLLCVPALDAAPALETKPADPFFAKFEPLAAPKVSGLFLRKNDRLAIIGDSITEQKQYSRLVETYLTVCVPELDITVRQYGWSGERVPGFLARMTNDCLRFHPTVATTCYGMNDHEYRIYEERIGKTYREKSEAMVQAFKANHVRLVLGSPGCVGKMPGWVKGTNGTVEDLNLNLCTLRNIDIELAEKERVRFADVFWPMLKAGFDARAKYGADYAIAGKDGVHPGWAGQTIMAYAFLKGLGVDGDIGTFTVDLKRNSAKASKGHDVVSAQNGEFTFRSRRYPLCATNDNLASDNSIRSAMALVPFNQELNRLMLVARGAKPGRYKVTWGAATRSYSADELSRGVNLAADFVQNPFCDACSAVERAVLAKQEYETKQIKQIFHDLVSGRYKNVEDIKDPESKELFALKTADGKFDREAIAEATEKKRAPLADRIKTSFVPVTHTIQVVAE